MSTDLTWITSSPPVLILRRLLVPPISRDVSTVLYVKISVYVDDVVRILITFDPKVIPVLGVNANKLDPLTENTKLSGVSTLEIPVVSESPKIIDGAVNVPLLSLIFGELIWVLLSATVKLPDVNVRPPNAIVHASTLPVAAAVSYTHLRAHET